MSEILDLIKDEKVEWKKLEEIGEFKRGKGLSKSIINSGKIPIILYGELYTTYGDYIREIKSLCDEIYIKDNYVILEKEDILFPISSTTKEAQIGKTSVYKLDTKCYLGSDANIFRPILKVNSSFIMYYMNSYHFEKIKMKFVKGTTIRHLDVNELSQIKIPIPSLETQEKIVNTLDKFTNYVTELQAELQARNKQYNYYRDMLLSENYLQKLSGTNEKVEWKTLGDIANYSKERINIEKIDKNNYVSVENLLQNKKGKTTATSIPSNLSLIKYKKDDILVGNIRPYLRKIWYANCTGGTNGDVLVISINNEIVSPKYLFYILSSENFFLYNIAFSKGAKMPRGDKKRILDYKFPLPSLEVQNHIVNILDKFDNLVNNIEEGLPREIELRQNQYEYFREQLLSFEKN